MIRNLVFDLVGVLMRVEREAILKPYFPDPDDREAVSDALFDRRYWDRFDDDSMNEEQAAAQILPALPERLREPAGQSLLNWYRHLSPVLGMEEAIDRMRREFGVSVYLLSNISRKFSEHADLYPVLQKMNGRVCSAAVGFTKPSREIYACLCETYGLKPEECLFTDDLPVNIAAAEAFGMRGYRFDGDVARFETHARNLLRAER